MFNDKRLLLLLPFIILSHQVESSIYEDARAINFDHLGIYSPEEVQYNGTTHFLEKDDKAYEGINVCDSLETGKCKDRSGNGLSGYPMSLSDKQALIYSFGLAIQQGKQGLFNPFLGRSLEGQVRWLANKYNPSCASAGEDGTEISSKCPKEIRDFIDTISKKSKEDIPLPGDDLAAKEKARREAILANPDFSDMDFKDPYGCKTDPIPQGKLIGQPEYDCYKQKLFFECPFLKFKEIEITSYEEYVKEEAGEADEARLKMSADAMKAAMEKTTSSSALTSLLAAGRTQKNCETEFKGLRDRFLMSDEKSCAWSENSRGANFSVEGGQCLGDAGCSKNGIFVPEMKTQASKLGEDSNTLRFKLQCPAMLGQCPPVAYCLYEATKSTAANKPTYTIPQSSGTRNE